MDHIQSALLFCGPFNVESIANLNSNVFRLLIGRAMWAYFGDRNGASNLQEHMTIKNHLTADFVPSFITDGNTASFEDQARELVAAMEDIGIHVESFFIPIEEEETQHEFQFNLATPAGRKVLRLAKDFLARHN